MGTGKFYSGGNPAIYYNQFQKESIETLLAECHLTHLRIDTFCSPSPPDQCCLHLRIILKSLRNNIERGRGEMNNQLICATRQCFLKKRVIPRERFTEV